MWAIEAWECCGDAVHQAFELRSSGRRYRDVGRLDWGVRYWDGFEVVLVEGQEGIECEGAGAMKQGAYWYGWVDGAGCPYSNDSQGSLFWISRSGFWVNVDSGIELVEDDIYVVGAHSSGEDQYFVVVKGTSSYGEFAAGFGP